MTSSPLSALSRILLLLLTLPGVAGAADVAGRWQSDFGVLTLRQDGNRIEGTYSCCQGELQGTLEGNRLELEWRDPVYGEGWVRFEITGAGRELRGTWARRGEASARGRWNAARLSQRQLRGEPSSWQVEGTNQDAGRLSGTAVLHQEGSRIEGRIEGFYTVMIVDRPARIEIFNELTGMASPSRLDLEWSNPLDGSSGTMTLRWVEDSWKGTWRTHDGLSQGEMVFSKSGKAQVDDGQKSGLEKILVRRESFQQGSRHLDRAESLRNQGRFEDAVGEYQRAVALIPDDLHPERLAAAYYGLGQAYRELGQEDNARHAFQAVLHLGDQVAEPLRFLAELALH